MLVVALAANVVKGLAVGLREGFQPLVPHVLPGMLIKFKEKKLGVVTALREAVDTVYLTVRAVWCVCVCVVGGGRVWYMSAAVYLYTLLYVFSMHCSLTAY